MLRPRWILGALLLSGVLAGCHSRPPVASTGAVVGAAAKRATTDADLTRPLDLTEWYQSGGGEEPLTIARRMAHDAGGTWVALAPRPLELVKWRPNYGGGNSSMTVEGALQAIQKGPTKVSWEKRPGYTLLYFGTPEEMKRLRTEPPTDVVGLYAASESGAALTHALEDVLQVKIHAEPAVFLPREAVLSARKRLMESDEPNSNDGSYYGRYRSMMVGGAKPSQRPPQVEIKAGDRTDIDEFMGHLAGYFGAEARQGEGRWELLPLTEPHKISAEIGRLQEVIKEKAGTGAEEFSSFASRAGGGGGDGDSEDTDDEDTSTPLRGLAPLGDDVVEAFDGLALLGTQAIPTLNGYLDAGKGALAQTGMIAMAEMPQPEARRSLAEFGHRLEGPLQGKARRYGPILRRVLLRICGRIITPETMPLLTAAMQDETLPDGERLAARMALLSSGHMEAITVDPNRREITPGELQFTLRTPPGEKPSPKSKKGTGIVPLASTTLLNGDTWAVFVAGRLGDPTDVWLARGSKGQWVEFLFTGEKYARPANYNDGSPISPGGCVIEVKEDQVSVNPSNAKAVDEQQQLMKLLQSGKQPQDPKKLQELMQRYQRAQSRAQGTMGKALTFSLAALRKDSDRDGLPDLVETRLELDPNKADTDGDGIPDGRDGNPRAKPAGSSDRSRILQALFTALYGGDPSREPILVQLEPAQHQEFTGDRARVLCVGKEEFTGHASQWKALRMLQFGGPEDGDATILRQDGPCLFDGGNGRAEVHFWQWSTPDPNSPTRRYGGDSSQPTEYVARFERKGEWKLTGIKRWKWLTADKAFQERQMQQQQGQGMPVF